MDYCSQDVAIGFQNTLGAILQTLGCPPEILLYIKKITFTPGNMWTAIQRDVSIGEGRGPYIGTIFSSDTTNLRVNKKLI